MASKPKIGVIAIDIEKTGRRNEDDDPIFAIGIATAPIDATSFDQVKAGSVALDLKKPKDMDWADYWKKSNFEERCWNEFWSKHVEILDSLQDKYNIHMVAGRKEFAEWIAFSLKLFEEMYEKTIIVTDTTLFDTVCVGSELKLFKLTPLNYDNLGNYRSGVEVDSFISGLFGIDDRSDWETRSGYFDAYIKPLLLKEVDHDHHPENDATSILLKYLAAVQYAQNNRKRLRREDE